MWACVCVLLTRAPPCSKGRESSWLSIHSPPARPDTLPQPQRAQDPRRQPLCLSPIPHEICQHSHTPQISAYLPRGLQHKAHNSPVLCSVLPGKFWTRGFKADV